MDSVHENIALVGILSLEVSTQIQLVHCGTYLVSLNVNNANVYVTSDLHHWEHSSCWRDSSKWKSGSLQQWIMGHSV